MRNYHIRISLQTPPPPASTASTSYSERTLGPDPPTFTPKSIFESLPSHSRRAPTRRYTLTAPGHNRHDCPSDVNDYRFGPITIDWSDCHFNPMSLSAPKKTGAGKEKELNRSKRGASDLVFQHNLYLRFATQENRSAQHSFHVRHLTRNREQLIYLVGSCTYTVTTPRRRTLQRVFRCHSRITVRSRKVRVQKPTLALPVLFWPYSLFHRG